MAISIRESCEPLSPVSLRGANRASLVESDAYRLLLQEARRYLAGEVRGRSFLVAGHRGSGKTTVVLQVCQELLDTPSLVTADRPLRPMVVLLHGPSLLPDPGKAAPAGGDEAPAEGAGSQAEPEAAVSEDEAQNALIQITLGLYRSLAGELAAAYRLALENREPRSPRHQMELMELAAQFELELDRCPEPSRLREYWSRAGLLPAGALFPPQFHTWPSPPLDQGFRELLALASACEMYRRISGTFTSEEERKAEAEKETRAGIETDTKGQDLVKPLAALLTGGLAFTAAPEGAPILAAVTGLIAALGAATVFEVSSTRSRKRSFTEETKFVRNLTVATLDREIPVLVERACAAGLVPLFVVDELDKIVGLSERITSLVRRLKKLVAERAFFCFLTDRDYFEEMRSRTTKSAYPMEYTYFTHRLFIVFTPQDLHRWLAESLLLPSAPGETGGTQLPGTGSTGDGTTTAVPPSDSDRSEEAEDLKVLPYVLLHQAKMHPIDLRRRLAQLTRQDRTLALQRGDLRTRGNLCDLMIQLAVEMVLDREEVREVLEREHPFRRLVYDALYYPSRLWEQAYYELDLRTGQEEFFGRTLVGRMRVEDVEESAPEEPGRKGDKDLLTLAGADRQLLFRLVRELCALLASREAFQRAFLSWESQGLKQATQNRESQSESHRLSWATIEPAQRLVLPLLIQEKDEPGLYLWRRDRAGLERPEVAGMLRTSETLTVPAGADLFAEADAVSEFASLLAEFSR